MSATANDTPESGTLPGRFEFVPEGDPMSVPSDPSWERFSDVIRSFAANEGTTYAAQNAAGTADAQDHFRATEEPSLDVGYDLQRFFVNGSGDPLDASGYGIVRDANNQLTDTLLVVERQELPGGNDDAGVRMFTVARGCKVATVEPTLDPSEANPILMELGLQPRKVRSYRIDQPSASTTLDIVSTSDQDTMDVTVENEDAGTTETITLSGTTTVTTTTSFGDIDAVWLADGPEGDITVTDGNGTTLMEIDGGLAYSDDDQAVDGDRGVPLTGSGSHASAIGTTYEHFVGDRFERGGSAVRARLNSASWSIENNIETDSIHSTRAPTTDEGNRLASVDADVAGPYASHASMVDALTKNQADIVHELSGGTITFANTVPTDSAERTREAEQAVASYSETFEASGEPAVTVSSS